MKASDLITKSKDELNKLLLELFKEQFNLRMQQGMDEKIKTHQFKVVRRDIARVKTILNQMERQA